MLNQLEEVIKNSDVLTQKIANFFDIQGLDINDEVESQNKRIESILNRIKNLNPNITLTMKKQKLDFDPHFSRNCFKIVAVGDSSTHKTRFLYEYKKLKNTYTYFIEDEKSENSKEKSKEEPSAKDDFSEESKSKESSKKEGENQGKQEDLNIGDVILNKLSENKENKEEGSNNNNENEPNKPENEQKSEEHEKNNEENKSQNEEENIKERELPQQNSNENVSDEHPKSPHSEHSDHSHHSPPHSPHDKPPPPPPEEGEVPPPPQSPHSEHSHHSTSKEEEHSPHSPHSSQHDKSPPHSPHSEEHPQNDEDRERQKSPHSPHDDHTKDNEEPQQQQHESNNEQDQQQSNEQQEQEHQEHQNNEHENHHKKEKEEKPKKPQKQLSPEEQEMEDALSAVVNKFELPPQNQRLKLKQYISKKRIDAIVAGDYDEAEQQDKNEWAFNYALQLEQQQHSEDNRLDLLYSRYTKLQTKLNKENEYWDGQIDDCLKTNQDYVSMLKEKHQRELDNFEKQWKDPNFLLQFNKPSNKLLQYREIEKARAISRMYKQAKDIKQVADQLQKEETEAAQQRMERQMQFEKKRLLERQEKELRANEEHQEITLANLKKERETSTRPLINALAQIKAKKGTIPLNAKPHSSLLMSRDITNTISPLSPRTQEKFYSFKAERRKTRLAIKPVEEQPQTPKKRPQTRTTIKRPLPVAAQRGKFNTRK